MHDHHHTNAGDEPLFDLPDEGARDEPDDVTAQPSVETGISAADEDHTWDEDDVDALFAAAYPTLRPINWRTLSSDAAEREWYALDEWVNWLRHEFGLPASTIPPLWHRHRELVWELTALRLRWLGAHDAHQDAAAPLAWLVDFRAARERLKEWVAACGTRLDRDRPTRHTAWPGEDPAPEIAETPITDRAADFAAFVADDVQRRRAAEDAFLRDEPEPGQRKTTRS